jgi:hypothetical protein
VDADDAELTPLGRLTIYIQVTFVSRYPRLPLKVSNLGWHSNWFYVHDDATAPLLAFTGGSPVCREPWRWGCLQDRVS